jgi:hypothetical protein
MSKQPNPIDSLISNSQDYVETRLTLFKLKMVDKSSDIASTILSFLPLILVFTIVFILLNIGIALLIGDLVGRASWGLLNPDSYLHNHRTCTFQPAKQNAEGSFCKHAY